MKAGEPLSLEQMEAFLEGSQEVEFGGGQQKEVYEWVEQTLRHQKYEQIGRAQRGLVKQYLEKTTGLSRSQITRLITRYRGGGEVKPKTYRRHRFPSRYTRADIALLASVDQAHERLSGPATCKILERALHQYGDQQFQRLAQLSAAHLYRLRASSSYRRSYVAYQPTRPTAVSIGERRVPEPNGKPGYIRVDTVHQGDLEGVKGVYHINGVDQVVQWEVVGATTHISEAWLMPVLEDLLDQFPFRILGFHSDNGSEFINHEVAKMLNKLLAEQTKSRPRRSNDNGLVECKNGAVIRKHMGFGHIRAEEAEAIDEFYRRHFNSYLNFHRPCGIAEIVTSEKGKQRRVYRRWETPFEMLSQIPDVAQYLKPGCTLEKLQRMADCHSDTHAAQQMQEAKRKLFAGFKRRTA